MCQPSISFTLLIIVCALVKSNKIYRRGRKLRQLINVNPFLTSHRQRHTQTHTRRRHTHLYGIIIKMPSSLQVIKLHCCCYYCYCYCWHLTIMSAYRGHKQTLRANIKCHAHTQSVCKSMSNSRQICRQHLPMYLCICVSVCLGCLLGV